MGESPDRFFATLVGLKTTLAETFPYESFKNSPTNISNLPTKFFMTYGTSSWPYAATITFTQDIPPTIAVYPRSFVDMDLLDHSEDVILCSGTVPLDISKGLVLFLYHPELRQYTLPRGRKLVGETLDEAAIRVNTETSGFICRLFANTLPNKAELLDDSHYAEPISIQQNVHQGTRVTLFWYIAQVDSRDQRMTDSGEGEERQSSDVAWVPLADAPSKCTYPFDERIVKKALEAVLGSTP